MSSLVRPEHTVSLLEQIYAEREASAQAWSEALAPRLRPLFERAGVVGINMVRLAPPELLSLAFWPAAPQLVSIVPGAYALVSADRWLFAKHYRPPRPVGLRSEIGSLPTDIQAMFAGAGFSDAIGMASEPEAGLGLAAYVPIPDSRPPTPRERALLTRVSLHLEAGARLRLRPDAVVGYVTPQGRVELGAGGLAAHAGSLGSAAQGIDRARTRAHRGDGEGALNVWPALVSGRLSLAERVDTDGKRLYDLYENAPRHEAMRALTERECTVVHECARGLANKGISYALGISQATVSQALASAAHKLGMSSARSMVRLVSGLRGAGSAVASIEKLSGAEREVASLVARGLSNAQIAKERSKSERTVANQVAAILRKTGARSRRELTVGLP